jgi:biotin transport system permease protein
MRRYARTRHQTLSQVGDVNGGFYFAADSFLHRCSPGKKMLTLLALSCVVFIFKQIHIIAVTAVLVVVFYRLSRIPLRVAFQQLRPALFFLLAIFVAQMLVLDWTTASSVVLRFTVLIMAAGLLTLTTRSSDMLDELERGLKPLWLIGLNPAKISLALSLGIRFIPMLAGVVAEVREAQCVRGLDRSVLAIAVPSIVRTLKMADEIADAIDARCYDSGQRRA